MVAPIYRDVREGARGLRFICFTFIVCIVVRMGKERRTITVTEGQYQLLVLAKAELEKERKETVTLGEVIAELSMRLVKPS